LAQHGGMKSAVLLPLLCACATAGTPAGAEPATYLLDPEQSFVQFEVVHFGTSTLRGRFGPLSGAVTIDPAAGRGEVGLRVATAQVSTGVPVFDARLRKPDLLAVEDYPEAYFVARTFRFDGQGVAEVRGEFTLRGVGQPLSLRARHYACRQDAEGEVCGGDFEGEVLRSDFGATFGLPLVGNRVRLLVQVEGRRQ
jgi:polyisoprenoid-binding protein YceI